MGDAGRSSAAGRASSGPLVGRERELEVLDSMVDRIGTGGGALVVRGQPGIGKSALLRVVAERARSHGATVLTATGTQSEARLAFGGLHQLLRPLLGTLGELPGHQRRALEIALGVEEGDPADVFLVGLATLGALTERATHTPLVLIVEDAHWLDPASAAVLAFVARRLDMEGVVLLVALREGVPGHVDAVGLPEVRLRGLDEAASRELLTVNGGDLTPELTDRIVDEAAGNPLALIELPLAAAGPDAPTAWQPLPLTARLENAFAARLPGLDPQARALLLLAALEDADVDVLSHAAEALLEVRVYLADWVKASASGLGSVEGGRFRFRHPLMSSAVQQAATADQLRAAHAALAEAVAADPDRAVWHRAAAAPGPDEDVAAALVAAAARATARGGLDIAFSALERAASLTADARQRALRTLSAADVALEQGAAESSVRLYREALGLGLPAPEEVRVAFALEAMSSAWSGAAAIPRFLEIAEQLAASGDDRRAVEAIGTVGMRAFLGPLDDTVRRAVSTVVARLRVPEDDPGRLHALALVDPVNRGREVLDRVRRISPVAIVDAHALTDVGEALSAVWADNHALPFLRSAVDAHRAEGRLVWLGQTLVLQAWVDARRGAVREALTAADEAARVAGETRQLRYVPVAHLAQAVAAAELGDDRTARRLIAGAEAMLLPMGAHPLLALAAFARGRLALATEQPAEAYAGVLRIFTPTDTAYQPFVGGWALADLADAALHGHGDLALVHDLLEHWRRIATDTGAPSLQVQLAYADAVLADNAVADERFRAAMSSGAEGWPFYAARAQLAYGVWLRRQHRDTDAREPLRAAAEIFEGLGQQRYADRAHRERRATGERARPRTPGAWTQLSPQELQIAQLAAEGLSNREIGQRLYLSHRTIGTHLYNLFPKLGITSRAQLRDALESPPST